MNTDKTLSISDIARLAGVSVATVSHVINNTGRFSEKTKQKVMDIIEQYGYVSNNAARSLKSNSSRTIGLIIPNISNDFFTSIAYTCEHFFDKLDYSVFICHTDNDPEKELRYFRKLNSMQVDGIILISCQRTIEKSSLIKDIPIVLVDRTPVNDMNLVKVTSDASKGLYKATSNLIEKGCRNIIYISSFLTTYVPSNRVDGYLDAMHDAGLKADSSTILQLPSGPSYITAETAVINYLSQGNKVDGIICSSDNQAIGAMTGLRRMDLKVPEDVKVFGFDNQPQSRISVPTLSTIERNPSELARQACDILMKQISKDSDYPEKVIIDCSLVERESTR